MEKETKKEASLMELRFWGILVIVQLVLTTWSMWRHPDCTATDAQQHHTQLEVKK